VTRLSWINRIRQRTKRCPSCHEPNWIATGANEPMALLLNPDSPIGHPELGHNFDGKPVLPVTCQHCGFVAIYSVQHLENVSPWE
jgi:hypothetical protein